MASTQKRIVDCSSVGEPPMEMLQDVETLKFVIYNFKDRPENRGKRVESPTMKAHGYEWSIWVYPRGCEESSAGTKYISFFLALKQKNQQNIVARFSFFLRNSENIGELGPPRVFSTKTCWGHKDAVERDRILYSNLESDGSLIIECNIQIAVENRRVWYPKELRQQDIWVDLYEDGCSESSDVSFLVGKTMYNAHKILLSLRCKKLYEISQECDDNSPIPIGFTRAEVFKNILDFVYTVKTPVIPNEAFAMELLVAADRFDCSHLKLYVESILVDKFLEVENTADFFIFADSHSCALLKEAATKIFVHNVKQVKQSKGWCQIRESSRLLEELLDSLASSKSTVEEYCNDEYDWLDVTTLRKQLGLAKLEQDGSREVLVHRLKNHREGLVMEKGNQNSCHSMRSKSSM